MLTAVGQREPGRCGGARRPAGPDGRGPTGDLAGRRAASSRGRAAARPVPRLARTRSPSSAWTSCARGSWSARPNPGCSPARCARSWTPGPAHRRAEISGGDAGRRRGRRARRAAGRPGRRGRGAWPLVLGGSAAADRTGPGAARRPRGARPGRADVVGRRAHRGADRATAAGRPRRPDHRGHHGQPAAARPRRPGGVPDRRPGRRRGHATTSCCTPTRPTGTPFFEGRTRERRGAADGAVETGCRSPGRPGAAGTPGR